MKKRIHKNRIYVITLAIASMAFGAAEGTPFLQDSQTKIIESMHSLSSDSKEQDELRQTLRGLVETELKQRFEKQEAELKQIEQRLEEAKAKLAQRKSKQSEIVDRRIADLLQKHDDLDWASSTASQNNAIVAPELQAPNRQKIDTSITGTSINGVQGDPLADLNRIESQLRRNEPSPSNLTIKTADAELTPKANADPTASIGKESSFVTAAESGQISAAMNEAIELEATIDTEFGEAFSNLSDDKKKAAVNYLSLPKRIRLLELKLEVLEANKPSIASRLSFQVSLAQSKLEVAKQELDLSNELVKSRAEGMMENRKKELEMRVAASRVTEATLESESFKRQMNDLANRFQIVRKKYDEKLGAKYSKPADLRPDDK